MKLWNLIPALSVMRMRAMLPGSCEARTALSGILRIPLRALRRNYEKNCFTHTYIWPVCDRCIVPTVGHSQPACRRHVATALNHLTVLEFHEPVTMAAAGSSDFQ